MDKVLKPKGNTLSITVWPAVPEALSCKEAYPYAVPFVKASCTSIAARIILHDVTLGCKDLGRE